MSVIAIDPGVSTGLAIHTDNDEYLVLVIRELVKLWSVIDKHQPHTLVFEDFNSAGLISKDGQQTIRVIGAIEAIAYRMNIRLVLQFPRERTPYLLDRARSMLRQKGGTPISHTVDALAHLLLYEERKANGTLDSIIAKRRQTWQTEKSN